MHRLLIYLLLLIVISLTLLILTRSFLYSPMGNSVVKEYIQKRLKQKLQLPLHLYNFSLTDKELKFSVDINGSVDVDIVSQYNLLTQYFAGVYFLRLNDLQGEGFFLREANLSGRFKGRSSNMQIQGQGTLLDANTLYRFHLKEEGFRHLELKMKGVQSEDLLAIVDQESPFVGAVDIDIYLPKIGKSDTKGHGEVVLHEARFQEERIAQKYGILLPPQSVVEGNVTMDLDGRVLFFSSHAKSNLFDLHLTKGVFNISEASLASDYRINTKHLELFSKNYLAGAFKVAGAFRMDQESYQLQGKSDSWGGSLEFDLGKKSHIKLKGLALDRLLYASKQGVYAKGLVTAHLNFDQEVQRGEYALLVSEGKFLSQAIEQEMGYQLPLLNAFDLSSNGFFDQGVVHFKSKLHSTIGEMTLKKASFDTKKALFSTNYKLFLPNIGLVLRENRAIKRGYISLAGESYWSKEGWQVLGQGEGLGGQMSVRYDQGKLHIDAPKLFIEKFTSLLSVPSYLRGEVNSTIALESLNPMEGNFSLEGSRLRTQPRMMKRLLGEEIDTQIALHAKGEVKEKRVMLQTLLETPQLTLALKDLTWGLEERGGSLLYSIEIKKLREVASWFDKRLYGTLRTEGTLRQDADGVLHLRGSSDTLEGVIAYESKGREVDFTLEGVSLEKLLALLGKHQHFKGRIDGRGSYHTGDKNATASFTIGDFRLKKSDMTRKIKFFISKDPSRIIYDSTQINITIEDKVTHYTLHAVGSVSTLSIRDGIIDNESDQQSGALHFVYDEYEIDGKIGGSASKPTLTLEPLGQKMQEKINKRLGKEVGGVVGGLLKGLKL
jgi:hypothetical protein